MTKEEKKEVVKEALGRLQWNYNEEDVMKVLHNLCSIVFDETEVILK